MSPTYLNLFKTAARDHALSGDGSKIAVSSLAMHHEDLRICEHHPICFPYLHDPFWTCSHAVCVMLMVFVSISWSHRTDISWTQCRPTWMWHLNDVVCHHFGISHVEWSLTSGVSAYTYILKYIHIFSCVVYPNYLMQICINMRIIMFVLHIQVDIHVHTCITSISHMLM